MVLAFVACDFESNSDYPPKRYRRRIFPGQLIKLHILAYLAYRVGSERIRPKATLRGPFTFYQVGCLALMPVFVGLWIRDARRNSAAGPLRRTPPLEPSAADVPP